MRIQSSCMQNAYSLQCFMFFFFLKKLKTLNILVTLLSKLCVVTVAMNLKDACSLKGKL